MSEVHHGDEFYFRQKKVAELREKGVEPYGEKYEVTHQAAAVIQNYAGLEDKSVSVSGRIISKRGHGKAAFAHIQDMSGKIQLYIRQDRVGEEEYSLYKTLDVGDIIGATGEVFKTKTGEITINISSFNLLSKSLRPLPEKWHGLKDVELRYRQRYVDLIVNPAVREVFITRSKVIQHIREYLNRKGFLEVETPVMHGVAGGASARPFVTHHNALDIDLYLRIATELHLKRLVVGGIEKVFELGRIFRNEGISTNHNPEFTTVEIYQTNADYEDMMKLTEELVASVAGEILGTLKISYGGKELDLSLPWPRRDLLDIVREYTGVDFESIPDDDGARRVALQKGLELEGEESRGQIILPF